MHTEEIHDLNAKIEYVQLIGTRWNSVPAERMTFRTAPVALSSILVPRLFHLASSVFD